MATQDSWGDAPYLIETPHRQSDVFTVRGRVQWALEELITAGATGCTPIEDPAPRWSAYVHDLRKLGVEIETIHEPHGGPFRGLHARCVLRSRVSRVSRQGEAA